MRCFGYLLFACTIVITPDIAGAQPAHSLRGRVIDPVTGAPVEGATIAVRSLRRVTYSDSSGAFNISLPEGRWSVSACAIGYRSAAQEIATGDAPHTISLLRDSLPPLSPGHDADAIMLRAITYTSASTARMRTLRGTCYSRVAMEIKGPLVIQRQGDEIAISNTISTHANEVTQSYGTESISRISRGGACGGYAEVMHRRSTAGVEPPAELLALGESIDLFNERVRILNADIPSPIGELGPSHYRYTLRGMERIGGEDLYVIEVHPAPEASPAFQGTVKILARTSEPIEADLTLGEGTSITFVRDLRITQRFEEIGEGIHYPAYQQIVASAEFMMMPKVASSTGTITSTIIMTELEANASLADVPCSDIDELIVDERADSTDPRFWQTAAPIATASREIRYAHPSDTIVTRNDSLTRLSARNPLVNGSIVPYIDFNRVAGEIFGVTYKGKIARARMETFAAYSITMERFFGHASVAVPVSPAASPSLELTGEGYTLLATTGSDRSYPQILNALSTWVLHNDYYDYYLNNGWSVGLRARAGKLQGSLAFGLSHQQSRRKTTSRFYFGNEPYRPNPAILDGDFRTLRGELRWGTPDYMSDFIPTRPMGLLRLSLPQPSRFDARLSALHGAHIGGTGFSALEGTILFSTPTITTGYLPMTLRLGLEGGFGSSALPPQYQFRLRNSTGIQGMFGQFFSAPLGRYGGTSYAALHLDHNFSDLLWRSLDLPVYEGRGPDITVAGSTGTFSQANSAGYLSTSNAWYGEIGFGIGRIPLPLIASNTLFLRFDARWGIGSLGAGRFGGGLGICSPF